MSLLTSLYTSNLIARQSDIQMGMINNNRAMQNALNSNMSFEGAHQFEKDIMADQTMLETEAMVNSAELNALNKAKDKDKHKINYFG